MKISYDSLTSASAGRKRRYRHFYETFGFIEITNAIPDRLSRQLRTAYIGAIEKAVDMNWKSISGSRKDGMHFIPNFQCSHELFFFKLLKDIVHPVAKVFGGRRPVYLGSDASCFCGYSFNWHRDWFTRMPQMKFNVYLESDLRIGGDHLVIPGSHHSYDQYCNKLSRALEWPRKCSSPSGFELNGYLPVFKSPRLSPIKEARLRLAEKFLAPPTSALSKIQEA